MMNLNDVVINRAYHAVREASLNDGCDAQEAEQIAHEVEQALNEQIGEVAEARRREKAQERREHRKLALSNFLDWFLPTALILVVMFLLALFSYEMYAIAGHSNKDYAGYGPTKVGSHVVAAVDHYYGDVSAPKNISILSKTRSHNSIGERAWKVNVAGDKPSCVYVWLGDKNDEYQVNPGACT